MLRCSFCNKSQRDVRKLIAGPQVYICDECVDICVDILAEDRREVPDHTPPGHVGYGPTTSLHLQLTSCSLCHQPAPPEHMVAIHSRGALCPGCIGAIEAAVAAERDGV